MSASCTRVNIVIINIIVAIHHRHHLSFVVRRSRLHFGLRFRPTCPSLSSSCRIAIIFSDLSHRPLFHSRSSYVVVFLILSPRLSHRARRPVVVFFSSSRHRLYDLSHRQHHRSESCVVFVMILSSLSSHRPSVPVFVFVSSSRYRFYDLSHRPRPRLHDFDPSSPSSSSFRLVVVSPSDLRCQSTSSPSWS